MLTLKLICLIRNWFQSLLVGLVCAALISPIAQAQSPAPAIPPAASSDAAAEPAVPNSTPLQASPRVIPTFDAAKLPRDLSPWGMFMAADWIVKAVMIGLAFASVLSWTVWLAKSLELLGARRRVQGAIHAMARVRALGELSVNAAEIQGPSALLLNAALTETRLSGDALVPAGLKERIASRLERIEAAAGRRIARGTGILATIGATAPFVGLFGTVWGIMNSFIGISKSQTTNLAVVAPGIAEALLATALGLAAAIPAVVIYNLFARQIGSYRALLGDASAEILRLVSRDLDRDATASTPPFRRAHPTAAE